MHAIALIVALLTAGTPGSSVRKGSEPVRPHVLLSSSRDATASRTLSSIVATFRGNVVSLNWTQLTAGVNGLGEGNDVFRVAVLVEGVDVCRIDVACDATANVDYVAACAEPLFAVGDDVDVRIVSMPCLAAPSGFHTTDLSLR